MTHDIFVSYAHQDRERVVELVQFLEGKGWSVWWDSKLIGGELFDKTIGTALAAARCVVVVWSRYSVESNFVFDEANRAYRRGVAVPILFDDVEIPVGFGRTQTIVWNGPEGKVKAAEAVGAILTQKPVEQKVVVQKKEPLPPKLPRWVWIAAASVLLAGGALTHYLLRQPSYRDLFLASRPGGEHALISPSTGMIGLTVWVLRPVKDGDPPHSRMLLETPQAENASSAETEMTPVRVRSDQELPDGSRVRLSVESSRDGLLYVINQELTKKDIAGPPQLVFPTPKTRGSGNAIGTGRRVEVPTLSSKLRYWELGHQQSDYSGELITVIVSPQPIQALENASGPLAVDENMLAEWKRKWGTDARLVVNQSGGDLTTAAEANARENPGLPLKANDAAPAAIYAIPSSVNSPMLASFHLRVTPKPTK